MPSVARALAETLESRRLMTTAFSATFGGGGFDEAKRTVQTRSGDIVVAGLFSGTVDFAKKGQSATATPSVLSASGDTDIYVADYMADGTLKWVTQIGGDYHNKAMSDFKNRDIQINQARFSRYVGKIGEDPRLAGEYVNDIAVDSAGNVYLAGAFRDTITAGKFTMTADGEFTTSYDDAMVLKISSAGSVTWAKQYGGAFDDDAMSIGLDAKGNVTVGGYYSRQINFNGTSANGLLETDGRDAGFVLRLDGNGNFAWVYQFDSKATGTDERDAVNDIAVTRAGEVYFAGTYADNADFDPGVGKVELDSVGKTDAVVGKLSRKGGLVWVESTGGDDYDGNSAITVGPDGSVYTVGYFTDQADVNPLPNVETIYQSTVEDGNKTAEFSDLLVSKFNPDGSLDWADQVGGQYIELASDITVGADGGVYLSGSFFGTMDADPGRGTANLKSTPTNDGSIKDDNTRFGRNDSYDWFVDKLSPRGKFVTANRFGQADDDYSSGITALADGSLLVSGRITSSTPANRDDRQEQSVIDLISPNLKQL